MERPTVLLAVEGETDSYLDALDRAGFAAVQATVSRPAARTVRPGRHRLRPGRRRRVIRVRHAPGERARADPAHARSGDGASRWSRREHRRAGVEAIAGRRPRVSPPGPPHPQRAPASHRVGGVGVGRGTVDRADRRRGTLRQHLRAEGRRRKDDDRRQHGRRAAPADAYRGAPARRRRRRRQRHLRPRRAVPASALPISPTARPRNGPTPPSSSASAFTPPVACAS